MFSSPARRILRSLPKTALSGEANWAGPRGSHLIPCLCSKKPERASHLRCGRQKLTAGVLLSLSLSPPPSPINFFRWQCSIAENSGGWERRWIVYESSCSLLTLCSGQPSLHFPYSPTSKTNSGHECWLLPKIYEGREREQNLFFRPLKYRLSSHKDASHQVKGFL